MENKILRIITIIGIVFALLYVGFVAGEHYRENYYVKVFSESIEYCQDQNQVYGIYEWHEKIKAGCFEELSDIDLIK